VEEPNIRSLWQRESLRTYIGPHKTTLPLYDPHPIINRLSNWILESSQHHTSFLHKNSFARFDFPVSLESIGRFATRGSFQVLPTVAYHDQLGPFVNACFLVYVFCTFACFFKYWLFNETSLFTKGEMNMDISCIRTAAQWRSQPKYIRRKPGNPGLTGLEAWRRDMGFDWFWGLLIWTASS